MSRDELERRIGEGSIRVMAYEYDWLRVRPPMLL
jgi:hypothetical protein